MLLKEISQLTGMSKERIRQLTKGYKTKNYVYPPVVSKENLYYTEHGVNINKHGIQQVIDYKNSIHRGRNVKKDNI